MGREQITDEVRAQYESMLAKLEARASTVHLAHAAATLVGGLAIAGAACRLALDLASGDVAWAYGVGSVAVLLLGYAATRGLLGRMALKAEHRDYEILRSLRQTLRLDDPSSLFP